MNNTVGDWLICYDIASNTRLRKVHTVLKQEALSLQQSVFHGEYSRKEIIELRDHLRDIIDERYDDIRIFPQKASTAIRWQGSPPLPTGIDFQPGPKLVNRDGKPI